MSHWWFFIRENRERIVRCGKGCSAAGVGYASRHCEERSDVAIWRCRGDKALSLLGNLGNLGKLRRRPCSTVSLIPKLPKLLKLPKKRLPRSLCSLAMTERLPRLDSLAMTKKLPRSLCSLAMTRIAQKKIPKMRIIPILGICC